MSIPVKANALGFYGSKLRYEGNEFEVESLKDLGTWMERLDGGPNRGEEGFEDALKAEASEVTKPAPAAKPRVSTKPAPAAKPRVSTKPAPAAKPRVSTKPAPAAKPDEGRASDQSLM